MKKTKIFLVSSYIIFWVIVGSIYILFGSAVFQHHPNPLIGKIWGICTFPWIDIFIPYYNIIKAINFGDGCMSLLLDLFFEVILGAFLITVIPPLLDFIIIRRLIYYFQIIKNKNAIEAKTNKFKFKIIFDVLFVILIIVMFPHSKALDRVMYAEFSIYVQPENIKTGIAHNDGNYCYAGTLKKNKIKLIDKIEEIKPHKNINIYEPNFKLIQLGFDYVWLVKEKHPGFPHGKKTDDGIDWWKAVHIYDKHLNKILTMQENVEDIYDAGEELIIKFKFNYDYAVASLQQIIDSCGIIDKSLIINKMMFPSFNVRSLITKDKIICKYEKNLIVYNRSNGNLIKKIEFDVEIYADTLIFNNLFYCIDYFKYDPIFEMNLDTLEYRQITPDPPGGTKKEYGLAIIGKKLYLTHNGELKQVLQESVED